VSWKRLDGVVPLEPASMEGRTIIQWDKDDCEQLGIVKVDLLGLGMMAAIRDTITLIREHRGEEVELGKIPHNDPLVCKTPTRSGCSRSRAALRYSFCRVRNRRIFTISSCRSPSSVRGRSSVRCLA